MTSMDALPCRWEGLLRIQLDDELLAHGHVDVIAPGDVAHGDGEAALAGLEPPGDLPVEGVEVVPDDDHRPRLVAQGDDFTAPGLVARDRHPLAVHRDVPVADELAGLGAA